MKSILFMCCMAAFLPAYSQKTITIKLVSASDSTLVPNAVVSDTLNRFIVLSDAVGVAKVNAEYRRIQISHVGFYPLSIDLTQVYETTLLVAMNENPNTLEEVKVSTGYQTVSRERSTGSFSIINQQVLNRVSSYDIVSRLEGVTNGLAFDRSKLYRENQGGSPSLRIRGVNTLFAESQPLVILDNFPYEGSLDNINPNDVSSMSILKDASAASIWGAKASNGVIVITTHKGNGNSPLAISFNVGTITTAKPDLRYNPSYISSKDYIAVERELFDRGVYPFIETRAFTPSVDLWQRVKGGLMDREEAERIISGFESADVLNDANKYLYRNGLNQQYAITLQGGTPRHTYYFSAGYDHLGTPVRYSDSDRLTITLNNRLQISTKLSLAVNANLTKSSMRTNGITLSDLETSGISTLYPYASLLTPEGKAAAIPRDYSNIYKESDGNKNLLDWSYYPLEEPHNRNNITRNSENRINTSLSYQWSKSFGTEFLYQYQNFLGNRENMYTGDSYYARNLINRFTQQNDRRIIPIGGVFNSSGSRQNVHSGRLQLNYNRVFGKSVLDAMAGAELRENNTTTSPETMLYGYSHELGQGSTMFDFTAFHPVRPVSSSRIPSAGRQQRMLIDRFVSYYTNLGYLLLSKYNFTGSARWDASNLYGVNTNQKGVPLWHIGSAWVISNEDFFNLKHLSYVRLRFTYGNAGNTVKNITAFPVYATVSSDLVSGLPYGQLQTAGNPDLRWEKTQTFNIGGDFTAFNSRVNGSVEWFSKNATDLIGETAMDPTTGIVSRTVLPVGVVNRINFASTQTKGVDIQLTTKNWASKAVSWETHWIYNYVRSSVKKYNGNPNIPASTFVSSPIPVEGRTIDALYGYKMFGLSADNGNPVVKLSDGSEIDTYEGYGSYLSSLQYQDLAYMGSTVPLHSASMRNSIGFKNFSVSANLMYKGGFYFRRNGIDYFSLINNGTTHRDYLERWQNPGDELHTTIPSFPSALNANRESIYRWSTALIEKGDNIRLQDISLSYQFHRPIKGLKSVRVYANARNLGVLWKATNTGLDPDYPNTRYPAQKVMSFGITANL